MSDSQARAPDRGKMAFLQVCVGMGICRCSWFRATV